MARKAIVLFSGGLDSTTTLAIARAEGFECHALTFRYGQRHAREIEAAVAVARALGLAPPRVVEIDLRAFGGSALVAPDLAVPKDRGAAELRAGVPITYVPARNTIFLAYALAWAEVLPARDLFLGVNVLDASGYPDCREEFVRAFEQAARLGTRLSDLRIHAPLVRLTKAEIIARGAALGVDYGLTHSCYDPSPEGDGAACGRCDACQLRRQGFAEAGLPDPTRYA